VEATLNIVIEPHILYFGTPVVLISTCNEDGTANLAPMSSAWWLNDSCMLGMSGRSQTVQNLRRTGECVLNLPSVEQVDAVNRLALLTGRDPVPSYKAEMGYRYEPRKFEIAGLTPIPADLVQPPRVAECPVQLEARVMDIRPFGGAESPLMAIETSILRVHMEESLLMPGEKRHIDPDRWQPLIMNFCEFYGLSRKIHSSTLAVVYGPSHQQQAVVAVEVGD
jgi:flavin reductase (DIM6/NTAB) family NADH-FMN oxidoreductase RutF